MTEAIQFNVDAALDKLGQLVQQHGQAVVDTAISVEQISALEQLVGAVGWIAVAAAIAYAAKRLWDFHTNIKYDTWDFPFPAIGSIITGLLSAAILICGGISPLLSIWNWVGLFNPRLALAHDIMQRLAGIG